MTYPNELAIARRLVNGGAKDNKFGFNSAVGTAYAPVTTLGVYRTPQVSGATQLRVKAGNVNDSATGSGARSVRLQGLDATGAFITEDIPTNGAAAGTASTRSFLRLFRAFVSASGTYADSTGSHAGNIIIENAAGTEDWAQISVGASGIGKSQSQIVCYTIPKGYVGHALGIFMSADSNKPVDFLIMQRQNILETVPPYTARRVVEEYIGLVGTVNSPFSIPLGPFPGLTDIIAYARVGQGTAAVSAGINFALFAEPVTSSAITSDEDL